MSDNVAVEEFDSPSVTGLVIRTFGKEIKCQSFSEVERALRLHCRGMSVAIHFTRASGIRSFIAVDVPRDVSKNIMHSYANRRLGSQSYL